MSCSIAAPLFQKSTLFWKDNGDKGMIQGNNMTETYDWPSFYSALCRYGPNLLQGIVDDNKEIIQDLASTTDMFWSDGLQDRLVQGAADGNLRAGVLSALDLWRENVIQALDENFGIELDWQAVKIDTGSPMIDELVVAASPN